MTRLLLIMYSLTISILCFSVKYADAKEPINAEKYFERSDCFILSKQIIIPSYPQAFNPSVCKLDSGYLMVFRYCPDRNHDTFSIIGIVQLNENFDPIALPQLLETRFWGSLVATHAEDARIFEFKGKRYITYNDNPSIFFPTAKHRRDIYIAELLEINGVYSLAQPLQLRHLIKYDSTPIQKNWVPFVHDDKLFMAYSIYPHEILQVDIDTGICLPVHRTLMKNCWPLGVLRGGTPAIRVGGKYLAFFHSAMQVVSPFSQNNTLFHYFMGAYIFSRNPPFSILKMTKKPIMGDHYYTSSATEKRVVFPGGFVVEDNNIHIVFGKDDKEIWLTTIDKQKLENSLSKVQ